MSRYVTALFVLLLVSSASAAEPVESFSGFCEFSILDPPKRDPATLVLRDEKGWQAWLESLPALVPGEARRLDVPNDDPALRTRVDWENRMVVVVRSHTAVPTIVATKVDGGTTNVTYELGEDMSALPADWGHYAAKVVARSPRVRFSLPPKGNGG